MSRKLLLTCLAFAVVLAAGPLTRTAAQMDLDFCGSPHSPYPDQRIYLKYDIYTNKIVIVSWNTAKVLQVLDSPLDTRDFPIIDWGPDCRYLLLVLLDPAGKQISVAWDIAANRRVGQLQAPLGYYRANWSPDSDYLVLQTRQGGYLWHLPTNRQTLINPNADGYGRNFYRVEFDMARGELLVVEIGRPNGVAAYQLSDGSPARFYGIERTSALVNYRRFDDNKYLLVFSVTAEGIFKSTPLHLSLWDRDTGASLQLKTGFDASIQDGHGITGNLSTRYFIINDYGIYYARIYVWDLQNLQGNAPYLPNLIIPTEYGADALRFVNENTVEIVDWVYVAFSLRAVDGRARRIDLRTGKVLTEITGIYVSGRQCTAWRASPTLDQALLDWACTTRDDGWERRQDPPWGVNGSTYWPPR